MKETFHDKKIDQNLLDDFLELVYYLILNSLIFAPSSSMTLGWTFTEQQHIPFKYSKMPDFSFSTITYLDMTVSFWLLGELPREPRFFEVNGGLKLYFSKVFRF